MSLIFHMALGALLIVAFYQDWKFRAITWLIFPALAFVTLLIFLLPGGNWKIPGSNLIFVAIVFLALSGWISMKEGKLTNIFKRHMGIGDLLFFLAILPLFGHQSFILFFISGMFLSGLIHAGVANVTGRQNIPLAGYLALYVFVLKCAALILSIDLFHMDFFV